jgi:AcrR family transcriptional regulator
VDVQAAWGLSERGARGPKAALSRAQVVGAALAIVEAEGTAGVSMSRVAARLGAATMALYRHVGSKHELLALMVDAALGAPPDLPSPGEDWRTAVARWAFAHLAVLRRHPWMVRVPLSGPPILPNSVAWFERGLRAMASAGLNEGDRVKALLLVNGFVRNEALLGLEIAAAAQAAGNAEDPIPSYGAVLTSLASADRFPAIHAVVAAGVFEGREGPDAAFEFGLARLLDGLEAYVHTF